MAYIDKINKSDVDYDIQDSKAARSVDGTTASHVEEANQIYTTAGVAQTEYFIYRTTAGDASISTGPASLVKIIGHTVQSGHVDEVLNMVSHFNDSGATVSFNKDTWRTAVSTDGIYIFTYDGADWTLGGDAVSLATYGLSTTGTLTENDNITVEYTALVVGTLSTASPATFVSTGFNQYNNTAGYAHVIGNNQYRIAGTYTSLGFTTTVGGTTTPVTVTGGKFTPTEDGYIYVSGASGDILIALVWSGIRDSDPFEAYEADVVTIPTVDSSSTALPTASYGMPSVGDVADELNFSEKKYYQRIGHYTYSPANLATVEALGVPYIWDNSDIFYVLDDTVEYTLASTVDGDYTANDFGTEEFTGTSTTVGVSLYYGNNLVDKLRNLADIQTIGSGLTLTDGELSAGGGGGGAVYSDKTTSNVANGGAVYIGNLDTAQTEQADPTSTDNHYKYFWALPYSNTTIPGNNSINIFGKSFNLRSNNVILGSEAQAENNSVAIGLQSLAGGDSISIGRMVNSPEGSAFNNYSSYVSIGSGSRARTYSVSLGYGAKAMYDSATAIGTNAEVYQTGSVALGRGAYPTRAGEVNVGSDSSAYGFNSTNYRVIGGVHDGQSAHDAVTVAQVNATIDAINTALSTNIPHIGAQS